MSQAIGGVASQDMPVIPALRILGQEDFQEFTAQSEFRGSLNYIGFLVPNKHKTSVRRLPAPGETHDEPFGSVAWFYYSQDLGRLFP